MKSDLRTDVHEIQYRIDHGTWLVEEEVAVKLAKDLGKHVYTYMTVPIATLPCSYSCT